MISNNITVLRRTVSRVLLLVTIFVYSVISFAFLYFNDKLNWITGMLAITIVFSGILVSLIFHINKTNSYKNPRFSLIFYHAVFTVIQLYIFPPASFLSIIYIALVILIEYYYDIRYALLSIILFSITGSIPILFNRDDISSGALLTFLSQIITFIIVTLIIESTRRQSKTLLSELNVNLKWSSVTKKRYEELINNIAEAVIAIDESGLILLYNYELQNILNTNSDLHNKKLEDILILKDRNNQHVSLRELLPTNSVPIRLNDYYLIRNDEKVPVSISLANIPDQYKAESVFKHTIVVRDYTTEKSLEDEKTDFISVVSHELRTPIAIAEGNISNAQIINEHGSNDEKIKGALGTTHDQILLLSDMVNDLDTLTQADKNDLDIELESIDPKMLLEEVIASYAAKASTKNLKIDMEIKSAHSIISSREFIKSILDALVDNAIKYTEKGSITAKVFSSDRGICFEIKDTGLGIDKKDLPRVFDRFFRSEDFHTREHNGTGLGLYVAYKLTQRISANLSVESTLSKGSTFSLDIPSIGARTEDIKQSSKVEVSQMFEDL